MIGPMHVFRDRFMNWKSSLLSSGLRVANNKTDVMMRGYREETQGHQSKFASCGICARRSVLFQKCSVPTVIPRVPFGG